MLIGSRTDQIPGKISAMLDIWVGRSVEQARLDFLAPGVGWHPAGRLHSAETPTNTTARPQNNITNFTAPGAFGQNKHRRVRT